MFDVSNWIDDRQDKDGVGDGDCRGRVHHYDAVCVIAHQAQAVWDKDPGKRRAAAFSKNLWTVLRPRSHVNRLWIGLDLKSRS